MRRLCCERGAGKTRRGEKTRRKPKNELSNHEKIIYPTSHFHRRKREQVKGAEEERSFDLTP